MSRGETDDKSPQVADFGSIITAPSPLIKGSTICARFRDQLSGLGSSAQERTPEGRPAIAPLVCLVYLIMRIHVSNISNSAIINLEQGTGIRKQLGNLSSSQWAWALSIFYYPYMVFEPLSTLALKHFTPSVWMSRIMITWGIISMCQGATQNYAGILACRFFLGAAEAGFYPGVLYHLSFWYPTERLSLRIGFFYACGMFSGTISGLLAYAISFMNGEGGLAGWRWVHTS
jgi:MFS family permease